MAFTVRPTEEETATIEKAAKLLGVKSMSKAVIQACYRVIALTDKVKKLERELNEQTVRANKAEKVISDYRKAQSALLNHHKQN